MFGFNVEATTTEVNLKIGRDEESKQVDNTMYKQIVGSLIFVCNSKLDICFVVGFASIFMVDPRVVHMALVKKVLRYLKETKKK